MTKMSVQRTSANIIPNRLEKNWTMSIADHLREVVVPGPIKLPDRQFAPLDERSQLVLSEQVVEPVDLLAVGHRPGHEDVAVRGGFREPIETGLVEGPNRD